MIRVEVLDRHGHVAQRLRCDALPATLGRAWTCDVVLDDRYVDPVHARLVRGEDGAVALEDAGSLNGIAVAGARVPRVAVTGPVTVHLGQTAVRLVPVETPVAPALPLPPPARGVASLLTAPRRAAAVTLLGIAVAAVGFRASDPDADSLRTAVGGALGLCAAAAAWAGVWALVGRSVVHQARFLSHFAAVWLVLLGLELLGTVGGYAGYLLNADALAAGLDVAAALAGAGLLLVAHFTFATVLPPRRRVAVAAAVVAAMAGTAVLLTETADGAASEGEVTIRASVRPAPAALLRSDDLDAFLADAEDLRRAVDDLAKEP